MGQQSYLPKTDRRRDSPMRLGGRRVLQLTHEPAEASEPDHGIDVSALARELRLDVVEVILFKVHHEGGVPLADLPQALGWDPSDVRRVQRRIAYKIERRNYETANVKRTHGSSLKPVYKEGRNGPWALDILHPLFADVLTYERTDGRSSFIRASRK